MCKSNYCLSQIFRNSLLFVSILSRLTFKLPSGVQSHPGGYKTVTAQRTITRKIFRFVNLSEILSGARWRKNFSNWLSGYCMKNKKSLGCKRTPKIEVGRYWWNSLILSPITLLWWIYLIFIIEYHVRRHVNDFSVDIQALMYFLCMFLVNFLPIFGYFLC